MKSSDKNVVEDIFVFPESRSRQALWMRKDRRGIFERLLPIRLTYVHT